MRQGDACPWQLSRAHLAFSTAGVKMKRNIRNRLTKLLHHSEYGIYKAEYKIIIRLQDIETRISWFEQIV